MGGLGGVLGGLFALDPPVVYVRRKRLGVKNFVGNFIWGVRAA